MTAAGKRTSWCVFRRVLSKRGAEIGSRGQWIPRGDLALRGSPMDDAAQRRRERHGAAMPQGRGNFCGWQGITPRPRVLPYRLVGGTDLQARRLRGNTMVIDDRDLLAYADGQLAPERRAEIEAAIANSADVAGRVKAMRASALPYAAAFESQILPPVPRELSDRIAALASADSRRRHAGR